MLLRSRVVLPITAPPIENGAVAISGDRIVAVGQWSDLQHGAHGEIVDLGDSILLPGLINAHCHLDYTDMAGLLPRPKAFPDWIKSIVALKAEWSYTDFAHSWLNGARMLLESGVTTVVDFEAVPELLPEVWDSTPLRIISCLELISIRHSNPVQSILNATTARVNERGERKRFGVAPHSPYTTSPDVRREAARIARRDGRLLTIHVAESAEEFEMFFRRRGTLFHWLKTQRDMGDCGDVSPVQRLAQEGVFGENVLAVHLNWLAEDDGRALARHRVSGAHCPRSHEYFGHKRFPLRELTTAGVNICLGTDSLASVVKSRREPFALSMFSEMRALATTEPSLSPEEILKMATLNAAKAISRAGQLGELSAGACADLVAIPHSSDTDVFESILRHAGEISASMIAGRWEIPPPATGMPKYEQAGLKSYRSRPIPN